MNRSTILFVCSANACRSPMAQVMANALADWNGLPLLASSAGVNAEEGGPPFAETAACVRRHFPAAAFDHRAHRLHPLDVEAADLTVCVSEALAWLLKNNCKGGMITAFSPALPDPVGGGDSAYDACMEAIALQMPALLCPLCHREFLVRPGLAADSGAIASLEAASFAHPYSQMQLLRGLYEKEKRLLAAVNEQQELLGYVYAQLLPDDPPCAEILTVAVCPEARKKGVGKALLSALCRMLREEGCRRLLLEVREGNAPARALYETLDFREISRRRGYYDAPVEDALILEKSL